MEEERHGEKRKEDEQPTISAEYSVEDLDGLIATRSCMVIIIRLHHDHFIMYLLILSGGELNYVNEC